jgi:hypothetical protein
MSSVMLLFWANSLCAQENVVALLNQRQALIDAGSSTSSVDQQLYQLGHVPAAIVTMISSNQLEFPYYHPIPQEKIVRIQQRLMATYSYVSNIEVLQNISKIRITYTQAPDAAMINELVTHFSYVGHEIH